mgnify:FL=1|tara:strand:- start:24668 stop:25375 length:708 start_codon:yes stop_codon:yes gene_type:complete
MKKLLLINYLFISLTSLANDTIFSNANKLYSESKYIEACKLYMQIIEQGNESAELYFNIGNCYYRTNDWANAIWFFEKSLQLKKKKETQKNLELTRLNTVDKIETLPDLFYKKWWINFINIFSTKNWQLISIISIWIVCILFFIISKTKIIYFFTIPILCLFITHSSNKIDSKKYGILYSQNITVKNAPSDNGTNLFSLHSGSKIEIIDEVGEWIKIKIANGNIGWITKKHCKQL